MTLQTTETSRRGRHLGMDEPGPWIQYANVRESLCAFAEREYQFRVWVKHDVPGVVDWFGEAMEQLVDDTNLGTALERRYPLYNGYIDGLLRLLLAHINRVEKVETVEELDSERMMEIRDLARLTLEKIDILYPPPAELRSSLLERLMD